MRKIYIPFAHAKSIYEIELPFFQVHNVRTLLIDLDNTLDSYKKYHPDERAFNLIKAIKEEGIVPILVSNNKGKRVGTYAKDLEIDYINSAWKPFPKKINRFIDKYGLNRDNVMLVGDQVMTDVVAGNRAKIRVVLTDKIVKEDQWTTHINRIFGRPIRKRLKRKGLMTEWRTLYGKN